MKEKPWYLSKSLWFGFATICLSVLESYTTGADWHTVLLSGVGAVQVFLRAITDSKVSF